MITFDGVTKSYSTSSRPALDDISVHIEKGEFVFLIGPSGSGKSTFLRLMVREEKPDSGKLTVAGQDLTKISRRNIPKLRQKIGYVFQDFRLLPKKTVYENVAFALQVIGKSKAKIDKAVPDTLEMVGLAGKANRYPHELSGGEQQRVAIARAFVNRPLILLADEPTGNLDPSTSGDIMLLLDRINRMGTTVVMSTHDNDAVDSMRRRVLELELGRLVRDDAKGVYGLNR
ncbi:MAG: cell division ATP-binding protein FtsE [Corynebacterium sp.]|uniref:cell division ATP-binding protein FtsE n=1 Tax=Corynebacterium sp. TaxID=1720 RepID=UPI0026DCE6BD|nr:cell division ATP-binding protein FtsE [Corynebacterium sp.]MDO5030448.1 cell division ATP-binding protein FtsE [Corynebacterium sp.]